MRSPLAIVLGLAAGGALTACRPAPPATPPAIGDRGDRAADPASAPPASALPCGVRSVDDLEPYGQRRIGSCVVVAIGGEQVELRDGDRPVIRSGEARPRVALDPRVPGPLGLRVGMTGADLRAAAADHPVIECSVFGRLLQCEVRTTVEPAECGDGDTDDRVWVELAAPPGLGDGALPAGVDPWAVVHDLPITGVVLAMPC